MKRATIMRGPSGAGKSTWVGDHLPVARIVSTDQFWLDADENYNFDPAKLPEAHAWCREQWYAELIHPKTEELVLDNTNIRSWEWLTYAVAAHLQGFEVRTVSVVVMTISGLLACVNRTIHQVPADVVARMCCEFESQPRMHPAFQGVVWRLASRVSHANGMDLAIHNLTERP